MTVLIAYTALSPEETSNQVQHIPQTCARAKHVARGSRRYLQGAPVASTPAARRMRVRVLVLEPLPLLHLPASLALPRLPRVHLRVFASQPLLPALPALRPPLPSPLLPS